MRTVRFHEFGSPRVLRTDSLPDPTPGPGEVLVGVTAAGIGFADVQIRAGAFPGFPLPFAPGFEIAGSVLAVGPDVDQAMLGRQVLAAVAGGGYAELAVVPVAAARTTPESLSPHAGLALLGQGTTALGVLEVAAPGADDVVLVEAAAGGVGSLLVQLVARTGATVVAAARGADKLVAAKALGADVVVDYSERDWTDQVRRTAGQVTVVLETVGGAHARAAFDLLAPGTGRMVIYGTASGQAPEIDIRDVYQRGVRVAGFTSPVLTPTHRESLLDQALDLADTGALRPLLGKSWFLSEAADAHHALESRNTTGKTTLIP